MRFVAGRGAVAESHRESAAGRGAAAERLQRGGAMAELLLAGTQQRSCIGKPTSAHKKRRARKRPKYLSRAASIYCLAKGQHARRSCRWHSPPTCSTGEVASGIHRWHATLAKLPLQLCRDCKEGCSKCKNCVELWEYGKDKGVTEHVLSV